MDNNKNVKEILEFIHESPGETMIEKFLEQIPKSPKKAKQFFKDFKRHIEEQALLELQMSAKIKKTQAVIAETNSIKALKKLKSERLQIKKSNAIKMIMLSGIQKFAIAMEIDINED